MYSQLYESFLKGQLILIEDGICRFNIRKDGYLVIYDILSMKPGSGQRMLSMLKEKGLPILARCPIGFDSNHWYEKRGFVLQGKEYTRSGKELNVWILF